MILMHLKAVNVPKGLVKLIVYLKGLSSQVFHFRPKCLEKPKCILNKFQLSMRCNFQDVAVQS